MCGIAGILFTERHHPVDHALLRSMGDALAHRGPDAAGLWAGPGIGLCHRRLSIIDLATGDQPMASSDGHLHVVFNGEIYNHRELRRDLESAGHQFQTQSDTEVLLHLYQERGHRLVEALRGMFAFALWDDNTKQLLLARDRVGIKPLYVYRDDRRVVFGSELKALLAAPFVPRDIDPAALEDYLMFGMVMGERSIVRGIERLAPATTWVIHQEGLAAVRRQYWSLRYEPNAAWTEADARDAVRSKLSETVRAHLVADVPVGAFLSGGVDSSIVVALAAQASERPVRTFSMGFEDQRFDELAHARLVANGFGAIHQEEIVKPDSAALIDELVHFFDEPFADSSAVPMYLMSRLAARSVKVVLSGDGGDEAFGGYPRYAEDLREHRVRRLLPDGVRRRVVGPLADVWPKSDWLPRYLRAKTFLTNVALPPGLAYANSLAICRQHRRLLSEDLRRHVQQYDPAALVAVAYDRASGTDPVTAMIAADVAVRLPDDYLVKVDRASMAHGLEVRPPFLDHELLELTATFPSSFKVRRGRTKWLLKEAYRGLTPGWEIDRPKQGFEVPIDAWFRGPLRARMHDEVLARGSGLEGFVDLGTARKLFDAHVSGRGRHGSALWALLMLTRWMRVHMRPPTVRATAPANLGVA